MLKCTFVSTVSLGALCVQLKKIKFHEPCESSSSYDFMACAADVLGVIPVTSYSFIKILTKAYSARSRKPYADCLSMCCRRICFSIRLGAARQLTAYKMSLDNLFVDALNVED
jgi:hypothetical protein